MSEFMGQVIDMAVASERYVHFLLDLARRPPQRCRVSLRALAMLEGTSGAELHQFTILFLKHRGIIEATARMKLSEQRESTKWVTVAAEDLDLPPESSSSPEQGLLR